MNGAESLARTLLACGIETCFANPGTSEMHFVAALDKVAGMRCVVKLSQGMGVGATKVDTPEAFAKEFTAACARRGPFLVEFVIWMD